MKKIVVLLAEGFEEIEAIVPIDILRRGGVDVTVSGVNGDVITGAHGVTVDTDMIAEDVSPSVFDGVVLPGGIPGANNLAESPVVGNILDMMQDEGKLIAAICASPGLVLSPRGLLKNRRVTGYPGTEFQFFETITYIEEKVILDGNYITSRGPGTAFDFAFKILEYLRGKEISEETAASVLFRAE